MPFERTERNISTLTSQISAGEIRLPEIQRGYVWKPTQVAKLIESLYRGYPTGYLLFWRADAPPRTLSFDTGSTPGQPVVQPLYLLDGQQRLTALHRVLNDHPEAQVVFNVATEEFKNQTNATAADPRWVKVCNVTKPEPGLYGMADEIYPAAGGLGKDEIHRRLSRLHAIREREYYMEVLSGFPYDEIAQIFVRVNSGGRSLRTTDLAMATLSANWPGIVAKLESEAEHWAEQGFWHIDAMFLARALTGAVLGRGLSQWSHARLATATHEDLEHGWRTVRRGLRHLVPLLKNNLKISQSDLLPSMLVLLPLIVFLGERPDEPLEKETSNGILYWLLVATIRARYSSATDTKLGQDIPAAQSANPVRSLLANLGIVGTRVEVTVRDLAGRGSNSPYFLLSFLTCQANNAHDWWYGTTIVPGGADGQQLEHHHIHPRATLAGYAVAEVNDLANLAFISAKANKKISDRSPAVYFPDLGEDELTAHLIPLDTTLRAASGYRNFLAARRQLLATAMTGLLDGLRPSWLATEPVRETDPLAGCELHLTCYESAWDMAKIVAAANREGARWSGILTVPDLESSLNDAGEGLDSDVEIGGTSVPVHLNGEDVQIQFGPFEVTGIVAEWKELLDRTRVDARPLSQCPAVSAEPWDGETIQFPVTSID